MSDKHEVISIGKEAAIALAETGWWKSRTHREIARKQLFTTELVCDFSVFHEAVEKALGRPVFTHEFSVNLDGIRDEFLVNGTAPVMDEIIEMIPEDKRLLV